MSEETLTFQSEISAFTRRVESLGTSLPLVMGRMSSAVKKAVKELREFLDSKGVVKEKKPESTVFTIKPEDITQVNSLERKRDRAMHGFRLIHQTFIISLISQYDSYLGKLIRVYYSLNPEALSASERQLSFSDLSLFSSLDDAREFVLESEVESVIRESHAAQFDWLERKLKIPLRENLNVWPKFIEVTERRNLFVHADGIVSSQYLRSCRKHGVVLEGELKAGQVLDVSREYVEGAIASVFEVGVKLGQVMWRKLLPAELAAADRNLNEITFDLLVAGDYDLAQTLLDFSVLILKKHSTAEMRNVFVLNRAQCLKWRGLNGECLQVLDGEDWSACSSRFNIGMLVLRDRFDDAAALVPRLVKDDNFPDDAYLTWPIFQEFRKSAAFLKKYQETYGRSFASEAEITQKSESDLPAANSESNGSPSVK